MDNVAMDYFINELKVTKMEAEYYYTQLSSHPDVYREFLYWVKHRTFIQDNPLTIDGHTAQSIYETCPVVPLGAFNTMIWLKMDEKVASKFIKEGMKIR